MRPEVGSVSFLSGGDRAAADRLRTALSLPRRCTEGDRADRRRQHRGRRRRVGSPATGSRVVRAIRERSSYHARNAGARRGRRTSGSCSWTPIARPEPDLLDAYFAEPVPRRLRGGRRPDRRRAGSALASSHATRGRDGSSTTPTACSGAEARRPRPETCSSAARRSRRSAASRRASAPVATSTCPGACRRPDGDSSSAPKRVVDHRHRESLPSLARRDRPLRGGRTLAERALPGIVAPRGRSRMGCVDAARDVAARLRPRHVKEALFRAVDGLGLIGTSGMGMQPATALAGSLQSSPRFREWIDSTRGSRRGGRLSSPFLHHGPDPRAVSRMCSSLSYFRRGQKNPRRPSLRLRGTRWTWRWGTLWLTTLLSATNAPWDAHRVRMAAESRRALANSGPTSSSGQVPDRLVVLARDEKRVAREERPVVQEGERDLVLEDDVAGSSPATIAQKRQPRRRPSTGSSELRQRSSAPPARCRTRARRDRRCSRRRPGPGNGRMRPAASLETDSTRHSVTPSKCSICRWPGVRRLFIRTRAAIVGTSRWAARRSIATDSVPLSSAAFSQMRSGWLPK